MNDRGHQSNRNITIVAGTTSKESKVVSQLYELQGGGSTIKLNVLAKGEASGSGGPVDSQYDVLRHGHVIFGHDVALSAFEAALESGMKLSGKETRRLLAAIVEASEALD